MSISDSGAYYEYLGLLLGYSGGCGGGGFGGLPDGLGAAGYEEAARACGVGGVLEPGGNFG